MEKSDDQNKNNENTKKMTPKNDSENLDPSEGGLEDKDLQEMQAVNDELDELSDALDFFEQRTDRIIEELKVLLDSNREIRQQIALEKATTTPAIESSSSSQSNNDDKMGSD